MKRIEERNALDEVKAMMCYMQGLSDNCVARKCGVSSTTIAKWRKAHNLSPNFGTNRREDAERDKKPSRRRQPMSPLAEDAMAAAEIGMSYGQFKAKQHDGRIKDEERRKAVFEARKKAKAAREAAEAAARAVPDYGGGFDCACISEGL